MQIILDIDGRKAIPIRAIPQVTSWNETPYDVVDTLAAPKITKKDGFEIRSLRNNLFAYQMDAQGNFAQVPPEQWESWVVTLKSLTKKLQADEREGAEDENRGPWQIKTVLELPDNVFIWLDEFQHWYSLSRSLEDVPDDYQNDCLKWESNQERLLAKNRDPNSELSESELAMLDEPRPWSEQASDQLCLTPIFPPAIENRLWRFDFVVASPVAKPEAAPHGTLAAKEAVGRSITKQQVIDAFEGLHFNGPAGWRNALSDVPQWIEPCRVTLGRKGDNSTSATWNPVLIATALVDKGIPVKQLDPVFLRSLQDWADEWEEASAYYR